MEKKTKDALVVLTNELKRLNINGSPKDVTDTALALMLLSRTLLKRATYDVEEKALVRNYETAKKDLEKVIAYTDYYIMNWEARVPKEKREMDQMLRAVGVTVE